MSERGSQRLFCPKTDLKTSDGGNEPMESESLSSVKEIEKELRSSTVPICIGTEGDPASGHPTRQGVLAEPQKFMIPVMLNLGKLHT